ncbi:MAG: hypothetical protein ACFE8B_06660 [Candidatus Hermodarchaeota archaeon]
MAITKPVHESNIPSLEETKGITFICPVCKSEKALQFPKSIIAEAKGLTTMSIAKGLVCGHQFQAFVDKNYMVRGYQRVDFEFEKVKTVDETLQDFKRDENDLFENLILEGNYLKYKPGEASRNHKIDKKLTLKEIYDEFWEFIDEDNPSFQTYIKNDVRGCF